MDQRPANAEPKPPPVPSQAKEIPARLGHALLLLAILAAAIVALGRILLHIFSSALFSDLVDESDTATTKLILRALHASGLSLSCVAVAALVGVLAYRMRYATLALIMLVLLVTFDILPLYAFDSEVLDWLSIFF